jgi:hypothetical protein
MTYVKETYLERTAREQREEEILADLFPVAGQCFGMSIDAQRKAIEDLEDEYKRVRRELVQSPYERLMLAGRLVDMCDADAARLLSNEIDPLSFDDVLASIEGLALKVRALKTRAEAVE